ncbi:MAG: transglycosylase domain-containing protein [Tannerellaceae bacterium]|jgi:hypothetical protein|nr:transglycosylase domain-containing protein [Tannerellaceae bacterium]
MGRKKYLLFAVITLVLLGAGWTGAGVLSRRYAERIVQSMEKQYRVSIRYQSVSLRSFGSLLIRGVVVVPAHSGLTLYAHAVVIRANIGGSSFSTGDIRGIEIDAPEIHYARSLRPTAKTSPDYAVAFRRAISTPLAVFSHLPASVLVRNLSFHYMDDAHEPQRYFIPRISVSGPHFMAEMQDRESGPKPRRWICRGTYEEHSGKITLHLYTTQKQEKVSLPFVKDYLRADVRFDTLSLEVQTRKEQGGVLQLARGRAGVKGLRVYHAGLSSDTLDFGTGYIHYKMLVGRNFLEIDSSATTVHYKRLRFHPYLRLEKRGAWRIRAALDQRDFPANDLFASFPGRLFRHLPGMQVSGTFSYHFLLDVDLARVRELVFESSLRPRNFRILRYGRSDLRRMSAPFVHTVYEKGKAVRRFEVGDLNPGFRPFQAISRYLPAAILHGEDFAFYQHRGFYPEAFHKSLVENIEAGKFLRGASTLSMQVVKNVFLNSDKTLARKLEEILIVWLIENNRLTHKTRMLEVYMNIIEWGPNVYGVTEASHFYFAKDPSQLTLGECIFLAYIIPYPKYLRNHFDGLRLHYPFYVFYRDAVRRLLQRGFIRGEEASQAQRDIFFRGPVIEYLTQ